MSADLVVVDDDSLTLEIVALNLRKTSVCHELFQDPEQAMQYLITTMPGILIVDFYMPTINGVEFLDALCEKRNWMTAGFTCVQLFPHREKILKNFAL